MSFFSGFSVDYMIGNLISSDFGLVGKQKKKKNETSTYISHYFQI